MRRMTYLLIFLFAGLLNTHAQPTYQVSLRPQVHFSPQTGWMNDPNGLVYFRDEYHMFFQYYPDSIVWGPMHWGHAVSKDLMHWKQEPIALYPDSLGYIFSG
ncbi:MAG TPA: glycoside hydrolase family 32 protein, partial [Puia sp.]